MLQLTRVSRVYPRDVSHIASAVLREMFLPLGALRSCPPTHFHALRNASLQLARGEKAGILGAHRSGKSTLAGLAAGQLQPTSGTVTAHGTRSLLAKPGAGFRPGLTVIENLSFRAMLAGVTGESMHATVDRTIAQCGVSREQAEKAIGNLSRFVTRQLGLTLLLELPADILVVDEVTGAGTGEARWELRGRLQDRIEASTSLVLGADTALMRDLVSRAWVLHGGRLYGPFEVDEAIEVFDRLPPEEEAVEIPDEAFDPMQPPRLRGNVMARGGDYDEAGHEGGEVEDERDDAAVADAPRRKSAAGPWRALGITVDGEEFRHSRVSLIRRPGTSMQVSVEVVSQANQDFTGGMFTLHGGNSGTEVGRVLYLHATIPVSAGEKRTLSFELVVPDWGEDFYGLTFCPQTQGKHFVPGHRLKILIFGVGHKHQDRPDRVLDIRNSSFERKLANGNVDTLPEGQQATREVGGEVQAAA